MSWNLTSDRPIYIQIVEKIQLDIISGIYPAGTKIPAVRELAMQAAVNPNTMQKALQELERLELVYAKRTSGRFITDDITIIETLKQKLATEQIEQFFKTMEQLGYQKEDTLTLIETQIKRGSIK